MPKVRDLAISNIQFDRPAQPGPNPGRYWMSVFPPKEPPPPKPRCDGASPPPKPPQPKALPPEAVSLMRQQLQQRVKRHVHI